MCVPALIGAECLEVGTPPYQHPQRSASSRLSLRLDDFSIGGGRRGGQFRGGRGPGCGSRADGESFGKKPQPASAHGHPGAERPCEERRNQSLRVFGGPGPGARTLTRGASLFRISWYRKKSPRPDPGISAQIWYALIVFWVRGESGSPPMGKLTQIRKSAVNR
jgi:hypothetical protein